ncbi:MAG: chalcone isomerase family protein [Syntrophobacteraceae bacterium]|nr:chalcone isomerase family protein [Syntrophobacteraceae bacterium]
MVGRKLATVLFGLCILTGPALAAKVEGVKFPGKVKAGGQTLIFNGGGKRTFYGIGIYVAALYLKQKSADAAKIVGSDEPVDVRLQINSMMVTSDNMASGFLEAFKNNSTLNTVAIKPQIDAFVATFKGLHNHDIYDLAYIPGKGVQVSRNDQTLSVIQGVNFKKALYGIWLGQKPVQKDLKKRMLGK